MKFGSTTDMSEPKVPCNKLHLLGFLIAMATLFCIYQVQAVTTTQCLLDKAFPLGGMA